MSDPKCIHQVTSNAGTLECRFCGERWPAGTKWGEIRAKHPEAKLVVWIGAALKTRTKAGSDG